MTTIMETFEEFATLYRATFARMMSYGLDQIGSDYYCNQLAELSDMHPAWAAMVEAETETTPDR